MTRERRYRSLAIRTLAGQGAGMAVGIALARGHGGAWALAAQQATGSLLAAFVLIGIAGWRPVPVCRWRAVRSLLRIGLPLTGSTLLQIGRYRVFAIMIGGTAGAAALGQVHVAFRLVDTVRDITFTALWRLLLPILSQHQHDGARLSREVDRLVSLTSAVLMPLCGGLALALVPVTTLILGPAWRDAGLAAEPLVALMALSALMFPSGSALVAVGQARFTFYANIAGMAAILLLVPLVRPASPWSAVLVWCGAQLLVSPYSLWVNGRALGVGPLRPLRAGVPMTLATAAGIAMAMMLDGDGRWESLAWRSGVLLGVVGTFFVASLWRTGGRRVEPREVS